MENEIKEIRELAEENRKLAKKNYELIKTNEENIKDNFDRINQNSYALAILRFYKRMAIGWCIAFSIAMALLIIISLHHFLG